jgi:hypothetical protein
MTIEMTETNEIHFPIEWCMWSWCSSSHFVQISLVDDRIVLHKPTATDVEYNKACKVSDNSYIRTLKIFSVCVPKQFFEKLGIKCGDKIDLTLEDNCTSIRKNTDIIPEILPPVPREPIMAFCCVCGQLLYTGNSLVKVSSKYICRKCIDIIKAL